MTQKRDTAANWSVVEETFVPLNGEIIFYSDLNKIKIGDGSHKLALLPFIGGDSMGDIGEYADFRMNCGVDYSRNIPEYMRSGENYCEFTTVEKIPGTDMYGLKMDTNNAKLGLWQHDVAQWLQAGCGVKFVLYYYAPSSVIGNNSRIGFLVDQGEATAEDW